MPKKYSLKAQKKVGKVMEEFKEGKLKSSSGDKVTKRKQAIAIGISEARQAGLKVLRRMLLKEKKERWPEVPADHLPNNRGDNICELCNCFTQSCNNIPGIQ